MGVYVSWRLRWIPQGLLEPALADRVEVLEDKVNAVRGRASVWPEHDRISSLVREASRVEVWGGKHLDVGATARERHLRAHLILQDDGPICGIDSRKSRRDRGAGGKRLCNESGFETVRPRDLSALDLPGASVIRERGWNPLEFGGSARERLEEGQRQGRPRRPGGQADPKKKHQNHVFGRPVAVFGQWPIGRRFKFPTSDSTELSGISP